MNQIRFVGGPWDGFTVPYNDGAPIPPAISLPARGSKRPSASYDPNSGPHRYTLDSDERGQLFRYVGRSDRDRPGL
jgi:hypothetical protein